MLKPVKTEEKSLIKHQPSLIWDARIHMPSFAICYSSTEFCASIWSCSFPIKQLCSPSSYQNYCIILYCCIFQSLFELLWGCSSPAISEKIHKFSCSIVYGPLQLICRCLGFFPPAWLHCTVCYSTEVKSRFSTSVTNKILLIDSVMSPSQFQL